VSRPRGTGSEGDSVGEGNRSTEVVRGADSIEREREGERERERERWYGEMGERERGRWYVYIYIIIMGEIYSKRTHSTAREHIL
jgi:hypothetical protein